VFRTPSKTEQAKSAVAAGAGKVTDGAQGAVDKAADLKVKAGVAAAATAVGAAVAKEKATDAAEVAREKAQEAAETIAPKVEHAREAFVEDVLPKLASAVAAIAAGAAAARETAAEAAERAPDAYAVLKGDAVAKKGSKGRWILLLGALAAGAAVMAWRKSNERPDPWATAGSYTPPKPVSEKVSDLAVAAKDKAAEVKDAAVDKAGELKDKASGAAGAAKDTASDATAAATGAAKEAKDKAADKVRDEGADTTPSDSTGPASDTTAVPPPVILSDAAIDDGAFDDAAAAADADADAEIPSISQSSEGADLSTPHLDSGSTTDDGDQKA
jgi:colicin import membrane protein